MNDVGPENGEPQTEKEPADGDRDLHTGSTPERASIVWKEPQSPRQDALRTMRYRQRRNAERKYLVSRLPFALSDTNRRQRLA